jgi:hypothetical protein
MSPTPLEKAVEAATARLGAVLGGAEEQVSVDRERLALAFVGFDVDADELMDLGRHVSDPYSASIIEGASGAWYALQQGATPEQAVSAGADFGQHVARNVVGAFVVGMLLGEMHRTQTIEREATSDD